MTAEEATTVVHIMCGADHECGPCTHSLVTWFRKKFPEHADLAKKIWEARLESRWEDYDE